MTTNRACGAEPRDNKDQWLDAESLKAISVRTVLEEYGLLENLTERGPTLNGPSPFSEGGILSINMEKNVWNDSWGRPEIEGRPVPGNVIGLVQAIEKVSFRRALEILSQRFAQERTHQGTQHGGRLRRCCAGRAWTPSRRETPPLARS